MIQWAEMVMWYNGFLEMCVVDGSGAWSCPKHG